MATITLAEFERLLVLAVEDEDTAKLESLALAAGTYHKLRSIARGLGIDLDLLEELLARL